LAILCTLPSMGVATVALTIGTVALTATQVSSIALLKVLGLKAGLLLSRSRGKRETTKVEEDNLVNLVSEMELEECFQLLFCSIATKQVKVPALASLEKLVSTRSAKFRQAKKFGVTGKETAKCSKRYTCSLRVTDMITALENF